MTRWGIAGVLVMAGWLVAAPGWAQPLPEGAGAPPGIMPPPGPPLPPLPPLPPPGPGAAGSEADAGPDTVISAEFLLWWIKHSNNPALVTSGSLSDAVPGALGQPGTTVLFGGKEDFDDRTGARLKLRNWITDDHSLGWEIGGFVIAGDSKTFRASPSGDANSQLLARPFLNAFTGTEDADPISVPGVLAGAVDASLSSTLSSAEASLVVSNWPGLWGGWHVNLLAGPRFMALYEKLTVKDIASFTSDPAGSFDFLADSFSTHNQFYGGQVGAEAEWCVCPVRLSVWTKFAFGSNYEVVRLRGQETINEPTAIGSSDSGLLVQNSNKGDYSRYQFAFVPEVGVKLGAQLNEHLGVFLNYTFIYWSEVMRPGDAIDRATSIQPVQGPLQIGTARPAFHFSGSDYYAHGLGLGLQWSY